MHLTEPRERAAVGGRGTDPIAGTTTLDCQGRRIRPPAGQGCRHPGRPRPARGAAPLHHPSFPRRRAVHEVGRLEQAKKGTPATLRHSQGDPTRRIVLVVTPPCNPFSAPCPHTNTLHAPVLPPPASLSAAWASSSGPGRRATNRPAAAGRLGRAGSGPASAPPSSPRPLAQHRPTPEQAAQGDGGRRWPGRQHGGHQTDPRGSGGLARQPASPPGVDAWGRPGVVEVGHLPSWFLLNHRAQGLPVPPSPRAPRRGRAPRQSSGWPLRSVRRVALELGRGRR